MKRSTLALFGGVALLVNGCGLEEVFPERAVFVANGGDASVSVIDPEDGKIVGEIAVDEGFHPHHLAVSPDGTRLAVAAPNADLSKGHTGDHEGAASKVYIFDATSGELGASIEVPATVHNVAYLDDFSSVALAMMEHGMIAGYDASSLEEKWTAEVGDMPLEVTPLSGGRIVVTNSGDGTLSVVDEGTHVELSKTDVGATPIALWNTTAGLFVSLEGDEKLAILNPGNLGEVTGTWDVGGVPGQVAAVKSGGDVWIAVETRGVIEVRSAASGDVTHTIDLGGKPHGVMIDKKAGLVYVTDEDGARVVRIDLATYEVKDEIAVGATPNGVVQR